MLARYLRDDGAIPWKEVVAVAQSGDLRAQSIAVHLLQQHWHRIEPAPNERFVCKFVLEYYLACMQADLRVEDDDELVDYLHSRYAAARDLQLLLEFMFDRGEPRMQEVALLVKRVTETYLGGDEALRLAIETGFLEHVLERKDLVSLFQSWRNDPEMAAGYEMSLQWGLAHPRPPAQAKGK